MVAGGATGGKSGTGKPGAGGKRIGKALRGGGGLGNRIALLRAGFAPAARGFVSQPEPRSMGLYARGKQILAGNFVFGGQLVEAPGVALWDVALADPGFAAQNHGFGWLDDLAAVGDHAAQARAQEWVWQWIARYGRGRGPGWTPDLTGRRLIRWINHAIFLLNGRVRPEADAYYRSLSAQVAFLSTRWRHAAPGLPRFEALTGLISAALALIGMEGRVAPAVAALAAECEREIDAAGGIPTRNPEELLEVFTLLTWAERALGEAGHQVPPQLVAAMERIAPGLRMLRHADGGLARFHGGGRGMEGRLDQALAVAGVPPGLGGRQGLAMGFARLGAGRTTVIVDAAGPPGGRAGLSAHASTLAFELTSGRRPLIVSCGSGVPFGAEWARAGRATPSHSTLAVDGYSSSRLGGAAQAAAGETLVDLARVALLRHFNGAEGRHIVLSHNGWSQTHGLSHIRDLTLTSDGRRLTGIDSLKAATTAERTRLARVLAEARQDGIGFTLRFHLHPDVDAALDLGGTAVSLALKSGEIWVFRHDGLAEMRLDPSIYLEKGRLKPRPTRQIVLVARARDVETRIGWTLAKAQDTPLAIRDLNRDDAPLPV